MRPGIRNHLLAGAMAAGLVAAAPAFAAECIAPANPGGGWDFTCRTIGKIMFDIGVVDKPIQVTNMAGGRRGPRLQSRRQRPQRRRGAHRGRIFGDRDASRAERLRRPHGGRGAVPRCDRADPGIIAVAADSPHQSLGDLLDTVKADSSSITFAGGSAAGGFDHLKVLMALGRVGFTDITKVKYIGVDGGADAITQTIGGHTQAMTGDMSEVVGFLKSGDIRVIAVFTEERVPGFDDIPTAREQGVDIVSVNWRGLYVPRGVSDADYRKWSDALAKVAASDEWAEAMVANGLAPFTLVGGRVRGLARRRHRRDRDALARDRRHQVAARGTGPDRIGPGRDERPGIRSRGRLRRARVHRERDADPDRLPRRPGRVRAPSPTSSGRSLSCAGSSSRFGPMKSRGGRSSRPSGRSPSPSS